MAHKCPKTLGNKGLSGTLRFVENASATLLQQAFGFTIRLYKKWETIKLFQIERKMLLFVANGHRINKAKQINKKKECNKYA